MIKVRSRNLIDLIEGLKPFLTDNYEIDPAGYEKYLKNDKLSQLLPRLREDFANLKDFEAVSIEKVLRQRARTEGVEASLFIHALRVLTLGRMVSPGIFEVLELLGKERTLHRMDLEAAANRLPQNQASSE